MLITQRPKALIDAEAIRLYPNTPSAAISALPSLGLIFANFAGVRSSGCASATGRSRVSCVPTCAAKRPTLSDQTPQGQVSQTISGRVARKRSPHSGGRSQ